MPHVTTRALPSQMARVCLKGSSGRKAVATLRRSSTAQSHPRSFGTDAQQLSKNRPLDRWLIHSYMGNTHDASAAATMRGIPGYRDLFLRAYGTFTLTIEQVAEAIAAFERTVVSSNSRFDRFREGDLRALTLREQRGMDLFFGKAACSSCHKEPAFSDGRFHNLGVDAAKRTADTDAAPSTNLPADAGRFKTPSLREVALTAPYMHDGSLHSLEAVVDFDDRGGNANPNLTTRIRPLSMTPDEKRDLPVLPPSAYG